MTQTPEPTNPAQKRALAHEFVPKDYFSRLKAEEVFHNGAPLDVDLGCGDGSFLIKMAEHHPERNFLGVERLLGRVRKVSRRAEKLGLENAKILRLEAKYTAEWLLPHSSVSRLHLLFPDPWPKARHHKRRLVQEPFLKAVEDLLIPGGEFLFKTDPEEYFEWAQEEVAAYSGLKIVEWPEDAFFYAETDFEQQWAAEGRSTYRLRAVTSA